MRKACGDVLSLNSLTTEKKDVLIDGVLIPRKCNRNEFCPGAEMLPDYLIECPNIENQEEEE